MLNNFVTHDIDDIIEKAYMFVDHFKSFWLAEIEDEYYFTLMEKHMIDISLDSKMSIEDYIDKCYTTTNIEGHLEKREDIIDAYLKFIRQSGDSSVPN